MEDKKELANEVYDAMLYTTGAVAISMGTKKLFREGLVGGVDTIKGVFKLGAAMAGGTILVKFAMKKGWLPTDPFTSKK